jgi:hypothetical protein
MIMSAVLLTPLSWHSPNPVTIYNLALFGAMALPGFTAVLHRPSPDSSRVNEMLRARRDLPYVATFSDGAHGDVVYELIR